MDTTSVHLVNEADEPIQIRFQLRNDSIIADFDHLINPGELGKWKFIGLTRSGKVRLIC